MFKNKLIASVFFIFLLISSVHGSTFQNEIFQVLTLKNHFDLSRTQVAHFSKDHPAVLNQFDLFAQQLVTNYFEGKGFIESDLHHIIEAVSFAAKKHQYQVRKDPFQTPYIIHPIGVAHNLLTIGNVCDSDILIAALLHDTVEDTETSFDEIRVLFGQRVESFVREVTDDKSLEKAERKRLQIEHAPHKSAGAAQIKLADKLYNLKDLYNYPPSDWTRERIDEYFQWAFNVVNQLPWVNAPLKKAVDDVIDQYQQREELA